MDWSDEDVEEAWRRAGEFRADSREGTRRVMTCAVEIVAARGGTMAGEEVEFCLEDMLASSRQRLSEHITAQGARVAALEAELENQRGATNEWKEAADKYETERDALRAELERLKPTGRVAEDAARIERALNAFSEGKFNESLSSALSRLAAGAQGAEDYKALVEGLEALVGGPGLAPVLALKRRVEELEGNLEEMRVRLVYSEERARVLLDAKNDIAGVLRARLSELRGRMESVCRTMEQQVREVESRFIHEPRLPPPDSMIPEERAWRTMVGAMRAHRDFLQKALGEKPAQPTTPLSEAVTKARGAVERLEQASLCQPFTVEGAHKLGTNSRYPCSPTCTHDDAATPGHAERVKARSDAFEQLVWSKERSADWRLGFEDGKERGADAMRAAIWEALQPVMERHGIEADTFLWRAFKAVIEGAKP